MRAIALVALLALSLAGLWASTQIVAAHLSYPTDLGTPWVAIGALRVYPPWGWVLWSAHHERADPSLFREASGITTLGAIAGCAAAALFGYRRRRSGPSRAHGSARWATTDEIQQAGLLREAGVVLGQTNDARFQTTIDAAGRTKLTFRKAGRLLRHDGPEHVFCFAPTRSGKGVGLVVPTLLSWPHSVLVHDIKKENWALTAGWRRQFRHGSEEQSAKTRGRSALPSCIAKAERIDGRQLELEFVQTHKSCRRSRASWATTRARLLRPTRRPTPSRGPSPPNAVISRPSICLKSVELLDPALEGKVERIGLEESCRMAYRRGGPAGSWPATYKIEVSFEPFAAVSRPGSSGQSFGRSRAHSLGVELTSPARSNPAAHLGRPFQGERISHLGRPFQGERISAKRCYVESRLLESSSADIVCVTYSPIRSGVVDRQVLDLVLLFPQRAGVAAIERTLAAGERKFHLVGVGDPPCRLDERASGEIPGNDSDREAREHRRDQQEALATSRLGVGVAHDRPSYPPKREPHPCSSSRLAWREAGATAPDRRSCSIAATPGEPPVKTNTG